MKSAGRWQLSARITLLCFILGTSFVALLAAVGITLVHLETSRELDALAVEELGEMITPFAISGRTPADFQNCVEELQRSHPYNAMAWRVWNRADGSIWGSFGRHDQRERLPARRDERPETGLFTRWSSGRLDERLDVGLLLDGGREVASEKAFALVALSAVLLAAGASFLAGRVLAAKISGALRDIAERTRASSEGGAPVEADAGLPDEIRDVVAALHAALARIRAEADQTRLLASGLAHELRTPLQNLLMQAEVALLRERQPAEYRDALARQIQDVQELIRAVDNLVTLCASPEARRARSGLTFDFAEEARLRLRSEEARAAREGLELRLELPARLPFQGDREGLMLALRNLVANALDWSPRGARVEVRVARANGFLSVTVEDQGPGVSEAERERIFRPFEQGAARQSGRVGYGLGLALVRTVADLHQGTVQVGSSPLGGASFRLELPELD